jgi:hypothetical protein
MVPGATSAKKGDSQPFILAIARSRPFPSLRDGNWQGLETLDAYGMRHCGGIGLPKEWRAHFLRSSNLAEHVNDLRDTAGYEGRPGAFVYRGRALPIRSLTITPANGGGYTIQVNGTGLTDGEKAWIVSQVQEVVTRTIQDNDAALWLHSFEGVRKGMMDTIAAAREALMKREDQALAILGDLAKTAPA